MTAVLEDKDIYLSSFARFEKQWKASDPAWLNRLRQSAIDRFAALGFPTQDDEEWRFTPLGPLTQTAFDLPPQSSQPQRLAGQLPPTVVFGSLADVLAQKPQLIEPYLARFADSEDSAFTALNTAFLHEGAVLYLPPGAVVDGHVELVFRPARTGQPGVSHPRVLVIAGANSQVRLVERYEAAPGNVSFTNAVTEVALAEGAHVDYYKLQQESRQAFHVHTLQVQQAKDSTFSSHAITLGGRLTRNDINAVLDGAGCTCTLNGLYLGHTGQLIDNHTRIEHVRPHCASHELYKGILDGQARGVFHGKIHVHPDAQKTDAKQTNQTLLLSDDAVINTKPQLEIYADDVKCTHGATVGQLDAEALFYLQSRGLGRDEARGLLIYAFANDIIDRIQVEPLRRQLEKHLLDAQHLPPTDEVPDN